MRLEACSCSMKLKRKCRVFFSPLAAPESRREPFSLRQGGPAPGEKLRLLSLNLYLRGLALIIAVCGNGGPAKEKYEVFFLPASTFGAKN